MYSALHIMQWFSHLLDVFTPKIKQNFFDFYILWIKTNVAYTRLEMIARTKYCTTTTASNWFVTSYYKLLPAVRSSSKHGRRWSSLLLYYSMVIIDQVVSFVIQNADISLFKMVMLTNVLQKKKKNTKSLTLWLETFSIPHMNRIFWSV